MGVASVLVLESSFSSISSRKSHFNATSTIFAAGQWSAISVIHLYSMFSSDSGESTCKARK